MPVGSGALVARDWPPEGARDTGAAVPRPVGPARPGRSAPPQETPAPRPGVSPRESPGHFGSWPQRHIHVEIAVMGTGNEVGSFLQAPFLEKIDL
jgi:hypothetical protein